MTKLSICCPTYRNLELIKFTIKNVTETCSHLDYELLIYDDGGAFDTETEKYVKGLNHPNIRYHHPNQNVGVTKAWNWLAKNAKGDYICIINNDIITPHGFYDKLIAGFDKNDPDLVMTMPRYSQNDKTYLCYLYHHITGFCYMLTREGVDRLFPLDERMRIFGSDNWLWMKLKYGNMAAKVVKDAHLHHLKSVTVKDIPNEDRKIYLDIAKEEGWNVKDVRDVTDEPEGDIIYSFNPKYASRSD